MKSASIEKLSGNGAAIVRNRDMKGRFLKTVGAVYIVCSLLLAAAAATTYLLGRAILDSIVGLLGAFVLLGV